MIESVDRNNALRLTESANYIIESYYLGPGDCICAHRLSHHSPAAFGRSCEVCDCALLISSNGEIPGRQISVTTYSDILPRKEDLGGIIEHSLKWQRLKTHRLTQQAIERIYNERQ